MMMLLKKGKLPEHPCYSLKVLKRSKLSLTHTPLFLFLQNLEISTSPTKTKATEFQPVKGRAVIYREELKPQFNLIAAKKERLKTGFIVEDK